MVSRRSTPSSTGYRGAAPTGQDVSPEVPAGSGLLRVRSISAPSQAQVSEEITVQADVRNDGTFVNPLDPDRCIDLISPGFNIKTEISVLPEEFIAEQTKCIPWQASKTYTDPLTMPSSPGTYNIRVDLFGAGSGNKLGSATKAITVVDPDSRNGGGGDDDPPTQDPNTGGGIIDRFQSLSQTEQLLVLGGVGAGAFALFGGGGGGRPRRR